MVWASMLWSLMNSNKHMSMIWACSAHRMQSNMNVIWFGCSGIHGGQLRYAGCAGCDDDNDDDDEQVCRWSVVGWKTAEKVYRATYRPTKKLPQYWLTGIVSSNNIGPAQQQLDPNLRWTGVASSSCRPTTTLPQSWLTGFVSSR